MVVKILKIVTLSPGRRLPGASGFETPTSSTYKVGDRRFLVYG